MDAKALRRRLEAAREFDTAFLAATLRVRAPDRLRVREIIQAAKSDAEAMSRIAVESVVGWSGVSVGLLDPEAPEAERGDPLLFAPELVRPLLALDPDETDRMLNRVLERVEELRARAEAARKN